jgi:hypothetical protein
MGAEYTDQYSFHLLDGFQQFLFGSPPGDGAADRAGVAHGQPFGDPGVAHGGVGFQKQMEVIVHQNPRMSLPAVAFADLTQTMKRKQRSSSGTQTRTIQEDVYRRIFSLFRSRVFFGETSRNQFQI